MQEQTSLNSALSIGALVALVEPIQANNMLRKHLFNRYDIVRASKFVYLIIYSIYAS